MGKVAATDLQREALVPERRVPSVRGRQLARELRGLRAGTGLTGEQVAAELGWSSAKVSRIETARTPITPSDLRRLLSVYEVPEAMAERLLNLARTARERGWWQAFADTLNANYPAYIGLEGDAAVMHCYQMSVINGLLQTERYARTIIETGGPYPHGEVERRLQIRLTRQQRLIGPDALNLWIVLDEATLRRKIGGREVMREQLLHLIDMAGKPNIDLQILPYDAGAHTGLTGSFIIFGFQHPEDPKVVVLETIVGNLIIEDAVQVFQHAQTFDELRGKALGVDESVGFLADIAGEL
jgi:transcriptional regulator with XRE-family HTH domain